MIHAGKWAAVMNAGYDAEWFGARLCDPQMGGCTVTGGGSVG